MEYLHADNIPYRMNGGRTIIVILSVRFLSMIVPDLRQAKDSNTKKLYIVTFSTEIV